MLCFRGHHSVNVHTYHLMSCHMHECYAKRWWVYQAFQSALWVSIFKNFMHPSHTHLLASKQWKLTSLLEHVEQVYQIFNWKSVKRKLLVMWCQSDHNWIFLNSWLVGCRCTIWRVRNCWELMRSSWPTHQPLTLPPQCHQPCRMPFPGGSHTHQTADPEEIQSTIAKRMFGLFKMCENPHCWCNRNCMGVY